MTTLPLELWWDILRLAVHIPGLFETKWDYSPDFLIWHGWESPASDYSASMQTKLSICLVCKSWREIGLELLYEHLLFTNKDTRSGVPSKVASILESHADDHYGYGRSTKRMDIHAYLLSPSHFPILLRLLHLCHNIRIFIAFEEGLVEGQTEISSLLQSRFSHSLRRVRSCASYYNPHLPNVPLDTLELSLGMKYSIDPPPAIATVSTLCLEIVSESFALPSWRFPSLRNLSWEGVTDSDIPGLRSVMTIYGPQLHSLHLAAWVNARLTLLPELLAPATNLRCFSFNPRGIGKWPAAHISFPSITHIALHTNTTDPPTHMEHIISGSTFPGLRFIRFLDLSNRLTMVGSDNKAEWMPFLKLGSKRHIRFHDTKGQLILI